MGKKKRMRDRQTVNVDPMSELTKEYMETSLHELAMMAGYVASLGKESGDLTQKRLEEMMGKCEDIVLDADETIVRHATCDAESLIMLGQVAVSLFMTFMSRFQLLNYLAMLDEDLSSMEGE